MVELAKAAPKITLHRRCLIVGGAASLGLAGGVGWDALARPVGNPALVLPHDLAAPPICRAVASAEADTGPVLTGPKRHLRFAYNGTGICTAAVPVALHRGYFEQHNLDVEFVALAGSTDQMLQALSTDKADAGGSMLLNWLKPLEQGFDVKLTTGMHGGCTRLLVRRDAGFADITALKGKTIGVSSISGSPRHFFAILLSDHGIDPDTGVTWREFPADLLAVALQRGEVQAIANFRSVGLAHQAAQQWRAGRAGLQPFGRLRGFVVLHARRAGGPVS